MMGGGGAGGSSANRQDEILYEAEIHSALGSSRLSRGELDSASVHLQKALELYMLTRDKAGRSIGDVQLNMAGIYFRQKRFEDSRISYSSAMATYKETVAPGKNPMTDGLEGLLDEIGINMEDLNKLAASIMENIQQQQQNNAEAVGDIPQQGAQLFGMNENGEFVQLDEQTDHYHEVIADPDDADADVGGGGVADAAGAQQDNQARLIQERLINLDIYGAHRINATVTEVL
eukprot:CAMPEP_0202452122 /NCGR_PEP_ID=MMETSP1360-20130828/10396_1 /ASSEMBLY_ACC=CAM_ASM_000848 /TAXON_ID=515479 /ORGANISM="Licmophora paradoxa, Strain CCMP2313" /LENGTH=231 /DNA_ID=CAMNT_0049070857 /DNA_START=28 /DNA_END=723 /DNA_ORIENTATION=-